jgi:flavin reductase (DIM6/NTAB) family NADH-FMN oxidoreductase RutF
MKKINISKNIFLPMPTTLVGTTVLGKANFMAVGWISRVNFRPAMIAIAIYKTHYTTIGIKKNKTFSVCVPEPDLIKETDFCGIYSGRRCDKSKLFDVFYGQTKTAPMIKACPVNIECKLYKTVNLPDNYLFIGKIIAVYSENKYLTNNRLHIKNIKPFIFTMPDNIYSLIGKKIGKAYFIGKGCDKTKGEK